jgi:hypothetical protein
MRLVALLASALLVSSAWAAGGKKHAEPAPPAPPATHFDVKGVALGSAFETLGQQTGGELSCSVVTATSSEAAVGVEQFCHVKGERKCNTIGAQQFCHDTERIDTFAGVETYITYGIHQSVVWTIQLAGIRPPAFDSVESTMESKYGKPLLTRAPIQNRMGATFEQALAQWDSLDHIVYEKYTERLDYPSKLTFYSSDAWAERARVLETKHAAAKQDM